MAQHYELAVIGSGSGGREAALLGARKGLRTAIIERADIGGSCFHQGCYAVRTLQACARQFRDSWKSGRFGNRIDLLKTTLGDWMATQRNVAARLVDNFRAQLEWLNVDLIHGHGEFLNHRTLRVTDAQGSVSIITADNFIVATGSRPDFQDSSHPRMTNSDGLLRISTLPPRFAIVGAGYIGCEFASIYRTLGSEVALIEKANRVLPGWEPEAGDRVAEALEIRGVQIMLNHEVAFSEIEESEAGIRIPGHRGESVDADLALMATGRRPNSEELGLETLGIDDSSALQVDHRMRLASSGLYAVGDVTGISLLDSTAFAQANVAVHSILGQETSFEQRWAPRCIHTQPTVATVGWTEEEAASKGIEFTVASDSMRLTSDDERSVVDPEPTFVKAVIATQTRDLLGCLVVGDHAAVIANIASIAIRLKAPVDQLRETPLAQPSAADALIAVLRKLD
jgi:dihydrolipoamide dehydrogenase